MNKDLIIYLCGFYSLGFAMFHLYFWRLFNWRTSLQKLNKPNRGIMQIANLRLIYVFLFTAVLCFFFARDLYTTNLGKAILLGNSLFWVGRMAEQFIFLHLNHPLIHVLTGLFFLGAVLFLLPLL